MRRRLLVSYLSLALVVLLVLEVPLGILGARHERDLLKDQTRIDAASLAAFVYETFVTRSQDDLRDLVTRYQGATGSEVAIVAPGGKTLVQLDPKEQADLDNRLHEGMVAALAGLRAPRRCQTRVSRWPPRPSRWSWMAGSWRPWR